MWTLSSVHLVFFHHLRYLELQALCRAVLKLTGKSALGTQSPCEHWKGECRRAGA